VHEYSIVQALLERVALEAKRHGASAVAEVSVAVGRDSGVDPGLLATAFELVRAGTVARDARLTLREVEPRWVCADCARPIAAGAVLRCAECGAPAKLVEGDELVLERLELEVA
jgi:hydrogenase nickel incorporation protein HypA/HybF